MKAWFKGFGKEVNFNKNSKVWQNLDYRIMMQNLKNHSNVGDGLYFMGDDKQSGLRHGVSE